ncbi:MAG: AI-2E family transporter [Bacteroidetes bacterium]|nr:AI-2E family transporter [Bacteroidota bacterium]
MAKLSAQLKKAKSNRPLIKVLFLLGIIVTAFWTASYFPDLVITLIISVFIAFILHPYVLFLEFRFGIRRIYSVIIIFSIICTLAVLAGVFLLPVAIERLKLLYDNIRIFPLEQKLNEAAKNLTSGIPFLEAETVANKVHDFMQYSIQSFNEILSSMAGFLVNLVIIPFITFFILAEGDFALKHTIERVPNKYFEMTLNVIHKIQLKLVGYLHGWLLDSLIIGILNVIGFYIIGVNYALLLGLIAGISNLIPYIGPFFGIIPAVLISLTQFGDFRQVFSIILMSIVIVQLLDNIIIQPLCFSKTVDMHPVAVILILIIGNSLMGIAGMLLAIPVATILIVSAVETYWGLKNFQITA